MHTDVFPRNWNIRGDGKKSGSFMAICLSTYSVHLEDEVNEVITGSIAILVYPVMWTKVKD